MTSANAEGGVGSDYVLPSRLNALLRELRPIAGEFKRRTESSPPPGDPYSDTVATVEGMIAAMMVHLKHLGSVLNGQLAEVVSNPAATESQARRAVSDMKRPLNDLMNDFDVVRLGPAVPNDLEGARLLEETYRDMAMLPVQSWLEEVVECLDDPIGALRKHGLPTQGPAHIPMMLEIKATRSARKLKRWRKRKAEAARLEPYLEARRRKTELPAAPRQSGSLVSLALIAFGLGWLLGGDDE